MKNSRLKRKIAICKGSEQLAPFLKTHGILTDEMEILRQPGMSAWSLGDGTVLELYTPGEHPEYLFKDHDVVLSFKVEDLDAAVRDLIQKGIAVPGGIQMALPSYTYCYARFADSMVVGFYEESQRP
jgi:hypothetical protein